MTATAETRPRTLADALAAGTRTLGRAGINAPGREARLLLSAATGLDSARPVAEPDRALDPAAARAFARLVARRAAREPVSHLLGRREFWSRTFGVGPDVLDPRPDSETLVEAALDIIPDTAPARVLDLGVGSGCLLLSVLAERRFARGVGVDLSEAAVRRARANADRLELDGRAAFLVGDWGAPLGARFDLILCNPPYIASGAIEALAPEVARFEPRLALDGGADGLDAYRALAAGLARLLAARGIALVEMGAGQDTDIKEIFEAAGLGFRECRDDLGGVPRCAVLRADGADAN